MEAFPMTTMSRTMPTLGLAGLGILTLALTMAGMTSASGRAGETKVPVKFSGGHDIGPNDLGRPIVLIAAGLEVPPEVFHKAFSGVTPARGGPPSKEEARRNKAILMKVLGPHGVTNERLDEVSNYYRFRPQRGELWPTTAAEAYAVVENGKVKQIVVTNPGSGYCTPPRATVQGMENIPLKVTLRFSKDLKKNGAVGSIEVAPSPL
jgi:hypothetical protein